MRTTGLYDDKTYFIFGYWEDFGSVDIVLISKSRGLIKIR